MKSGNSLGTEFTWRKQTPRSYEIQELESTGGGFFNPFRAVGVNLIHAVRQRACAVD